VRRASLTALAAVCLVAHVALGAEPEPSPNGIAIVVGRNSAVKNVTQDELREIYLRRQRLWHDGTRAIPVNLPPTNPVRDAFSRLVLGRSTQDTVTYWNTRYFEGITPPQVLPSTRAIILFLEAEPGAIAYLPVADVDEKTCRTLLILDVPSRGGEDPRTTLENEVPAQLP
jgi:hypothetical protein